MEIVEVIAKCLAEDPKDRPTVTELLKIGKIISKGNERLSITRETGSKMRGFSDDEESFKEEEEEDGDDDFRGGAKEKIFIEREEISKSNRKKESKKSSSIKPTLKQEKSKDVPVSRMMEKKEAPKKKSKESSSVLGLLSPKSSKKSSGPVLSGKMSSDDYYSMQPETSQPLSMNMSFDAPMASLLESDDLLLPPAPPKPSSSSAGPPPPPPAGSSQISTVSRASTSAPKAPSKSKNLRDEIQGGRKLSKLDKREEPMEMMMLSQEEGEKEEMIEILNERTNEIIGDTPTPNQLFSLIDSEVMIEPLKSEESQTQSTRIRQLEISRLLEIIEKEEIANKDFAIAGLLDYVEKDVYSSIKYDHDSSVKNSVENWSKIVSQLKPFYNTSMSQNTKDQYDNLSSVLKKMVDAQKISDLESLMTSSSYSSYSTGDYQMVSDKRLQLEENMKMASPKKGGGISIDFCSCFSPPKPKVKSAADLLAEELSKPNESLNILERGLEKKESFKTDKSIGTGCSANVYLVSSKSTPDEKYVLKIFKDGAEDDARQEISVYEKLQNEHIVKYFEYFKYDDGYGAVQTAIKLEYCNGGDLSKLCKSKKRKKEKENLTQKEVLKILIQIVTGLIYLHEKKFVHCDLKPGNVFLKDEKVKIADFGFAVPFGSRIMGGSLEYMPPEQFENKPGFVANPSIDIWSFACLVLELLTKKKHDLKISINKNENYVDELWHREGLNETYSTDLRDLIINCTKMDSSERPTSKQIYLSMLAMSERTSL